MGNGCPKCTGSISNLCIKWLDSISVDIREFKIRINGKLYVVDGYDPDTKTVYEFNGIFWHGHPDFYEPKDVNPCNNRKYGELYQATLDKEQNLKLAGYNVISMWEHEFNPSLCSQMLKNKND